MKPHKERWVDPEYAYSKLWGRLRRIYGCDFRTYRKNRGRHVLFIPENPTAPKIYVFWQKEPFYTFGKKFSKFMERFPGTDSSGYSIELDCLKEAIGYGADYIMVLDPQCRIYRASAMLWYNFAKKHELIKGQRTINDFFSGEKPETSDCSYCLPLNMFERVDSPGDNFIAGSSGQQIRDEG